MKSLGPRKSLALERLLDDFSIEYSNSGTGWLQLQCPLCDDHKQHLGWSGTVFHCHRCGTHGRIEVLSALLNLTPHQTGKELQKYEGRIEHHPVHPNRLHNELSDKTTVKLPYGTAPMTAQHREYLKARDFDPEQLEKEWGLLGTGKLGPFAHRIIIPVVSHLTNTICCFQGRDITDLSPKKYKSCPDGEAVIPIKSCLYGLEKVRGDSVVVTEGPTKVWRLGKGSVATFGATVSSEQVLLLSKFRRVLILFDEDEAGMEGADKLSRQLAPLVVGVTVVTLGVADPADPGDLTDGDAEELMRSLLC